MYPRHKGNHWEFFCKGRRLFGQKLESSRMVAGAAVFLAHPINNDAFQLNLGVNETTQM